VWVVCWRYPVLSETIVPTEVAELIRQGIDAVLVPLHRLEGTTETFGLADDHIMRPAAWPSGRRAQVTMLISQLSKRLAGASRVMWRVPAFIGDLIMRSFGRGRDWTLSVILGAMFVLVMLIVHWFWADFMLTPHARNFGFGADKWDYGTRLGPWRYEFWNLDRNAAGHWSVGLFARRMVFATVFAILSTRVGLVIGDAISRVRR
jgi:hypothetical protein